MQFLLQLRVISYVHDALYYFTIQCPCLIFKLCHKKASQYVVEKYRIPIP